MNSKLLKTLSLSAIAGLVMTNTVSADFISVNYGGAMSNAAWHALEKPFMDKTGIKVTPEVYNGGLAQIKSQIESGKVTWGVVQSSVSSAMQGCDEGLLEPLPKLPAGSNGVAAEQDFFEGSLGECHVAIISWSNIVAFNKDKFPGEKPSTIQDFFDVNKFPGKRGMRKDAIVNLEWALMADGVAKKDVYKVLKAPGGVDRAFAKLDTIKDHLVLWTAGAQPPQMLADGEVVMSTAYNGRIYNAMIKENKPFEIIWDGQVADYDVLIVPKGTPNKEQVFEFIKFATSEAQGVKMLEYISYGPGRKSAYAKVPESILPHLSSNPANMAQGISLDTEYWSYNRDELKERFITWVSN